MALGLYLLAREEPREEEAADSVGAAFVWLVSAAVGAGGTVPDGASGLALSVITIGSAAVVAAAALVVLPGTAGIGSDSAVLAAAGAREVPPRGLPLPLGGILVLQIID